MKVQNSGEKVYVYAEPIITTRDIASARALGGPYTHVAGGTLFEVHVTFTKEAADRLGKFTEGHIGEMLAIVVKGNLVSAPTIQGRFSDEAVISGNFSEKEAKQIAKLLNDK
jgi:preprotein translocase subunit SecD